MDCEKAYKYQPEPITKAKGVTILWNLPKLQEK